MGISYWSRGRADITRRTLCLVLTLALVGGFAGLSLARPASALASRPGTAADLPSAMTGPVAGGAADGSATVAPKGVTPAAAPLLTIVKDSTTPAPLLPTFPITYTVTVANIGDAPARDLLLTDLLGVGMRKTTPTVSSIKIDGATIASAGHWKTSYVVGTGLLTIDFNDAAAPAVQQDLAAGSTMVITIVCTPEATTGAGRVMDNTATMSYGSLDGPGGIAYTPVSSDFTVTLERPKITKTAAPAAVTVGQTIDCSITVTVPEYCRIYWPTIDDTLDVYGVEYVPGSAKLTRISGAPLIQAAFTNGVATPAVSDTGSGSLLSWSLMGPAKANDYIDNSNSTVPYVFALSYQLKVTGIAPDTSRVFDPPAVIGSAHDNLSDHGRIHWNSLDQNARPANSGHDAGSNRPVVHIDQPWLVATKTVLTAGPVAGGQPARYRLTYHNDGFWPAEDVTVRDVLPIGMRDRTPKVTLVTVAGVDQTLGSGYLVSPAYDPSTGVLTVDLHEPLAFVDTPIPSGKSLVIEIRAWTDDDVMAGDALTDVTGASFATLADGTGRFFAMPETLPAAAGDSATTQIESPTIVKSVVSGSPATIGDVVSYRLRVTVPEGTVLTTPQIVDTIAAGGMAYVPGSVALSDVSGAPVGPAALQGDGSWSAAASTLTIPLYPGEGRDTVDNSGANGPYVFDVTYDMQVTGLDTLGAWIWSPAVSNTSTDNAALTWELAAGETSVSSGDVSTSIVQPWLKTTKSFSKSTAQIGGEATATVVVTNAGSSPAYANDLGEASFTDLLPPGLGFGQMVSVTHSVNGLLQDPADYTWSTLGTTLTGTTLDVFYASPSTILQPGESLTFVYTVVVDPSAGPSATLINSADANWSSKPGDVPGERAYDDSDPLEPTSDTSSASLAVTNPHLSLAKTLVTPASGIVASGGLVAYRIDITNDGNTTISTAPMRDLFDATRLQFVEASLPSDSFTPGEIGWTDALGGTPLPVGTMLSIDVTFTATAAGVGVEDTATLSGAVDTNGDPAPEVSASNDLLTITNPHLTITKTLRDGTPKLVPLGSLVTYDLHVVNDGDTSFVEFVMLDLAASGELEYVSSEPSATGALGPMVMWVGALDTPMKSGDSTSAAVTFRAASASAGVINLAGAGGIDVNGDGTPLAVAQTIGPAIYDPASIVCSKTAEPKSGTIVLPGQEITYTVEFRNDSPATIPGASIVDTLPASVTYVAGSATLDGAPLSDATVWDAESRIISAPLGDVGPESRGTLQFKVKVAPEALSRKGVLNVAALSYDGLAVATSDATFHPVDPFDLVKAGVDLNGGDLRTGDVIEWRITVTNTGLTPTTHVVVNDTVPAGTTYVPGSITGLGADASAVPVVKWDIGSMAVGQSLVLTFRTTVNAGLKNGTQIRNQAVVTSDDSAPKVSTNAATSIVNDPTVLFVRTSGNEVPAILGGLLALVAAAGLWLLWRRPRRTAGGAGA